MAYIDTTPRVGGGRFTTGGNVNNEVYVTSNANSGANTLRDLVTDSTSKVVRFDPAMKEQTIQLTSGIEIGPNKTIDGLDAKVLIKGGRLRVVSSEVILRNMIVRPGSDNTGDKPENRDCISVGDQPKRLSNIIIANCSGTWSVDELMTSWGANSNITFINNMMSHALNFASPASHPKKDGNHSMCFLIGKQDDETFRPNNISVIGNMFGSSWFRHGLIKDGAQFIEFVNNWCQNWKQQGMEASKGVTMDMIGNVYQEGQDTGGANAIQLNNDAGSGYYYADNGRADGSSVSQNSTASRGSRYVTNSGYTPLARTAVLDYILQNVGAHSPAQGLVRSDICDTILYEALQGWWRTIDNPSDWPSGPASARSNSLTGYNIEGNYPYAERPTAVVSPPATTITPITLAAGATSVIVPGANGVPISLTHKSRNAVGDSAIAGPVVGTPVAAAAPAPSFGPPIVPILRNSVAVNKITKTGTNTFRFHGDGSTATFLRFTTVIGTEYNVDIQLVSRANTAPSSSVKLSDSINKDMVADDIIATVPPFNWTAISNDFRLQRTAGAIDIELMVIIRPVL